MRRPTHSSVFALLAAIAIALGAPVEAAGREGRTQRRAAGAHKRSHSASRPLARVQTTAMRPAEQAPAEIEASADSPAAEAHDTDGVDKRPRQRARPRSPSRKQARALRPAKRSLVARARIAALHLAEALHLYHPQPHHGQGGRPRLTEERPWFEVVGSLLGVDVGLTLSEITRVKGRRGSLELVHVVGPDGSQNFESVLVRKPLGLGQRLEVQGPAINTAAGLPIGFRAVGLGLTSDLFEPGQNRAISYTAEVKLTERSLLYWAPFWAPGAASAIDGALGAAGHHTVANLVGGALPIVSAALAVQSAVRAYRTFKNPRAGKLEKALAVGHVVADGIRVGLPVVGTLINVALIGVTAGVSYLKVKRARAVAEHPVDPRYLRRCARGGCTH